MQNTQETNKTAINDNMTEAKREVTASSGRPVQIQIPVRDSVQPVDLEELVKINSYRLYM